MKDAVATMGTILPADVGGRDAVHVAVIAVEAHEILSPGQDVDTDGSTIAEPVGIVDPFLKVQVQIGQRFWLYLYPRTITSLRHNWTHPSFHDEIQSEVYGSPAQRLASEKWLRAFAHNCGPDYEALINAAVGDHHKNGVDDGYLCSRLENVGPGKSCLYFGGMDADGPIPPEFWHHVEVVTGRRIPAENRAELFSCSC